MITPTMRFLSPFALLFLTACTASLWSDEPPAVSHAEGLADLLTLEWTRPEALSDGLAMIMPNNRGATLRVRPVDRVGEVHPGLEANTILDEYEWELSTGNGRLLPRGQGICRYLPMRVTEEEPVVVIVRLTRTYIERRSGLRRNREHQVQATALARIVAPVSADHLDGQWRLRGYEIGEYPDPRDPDLLEELRGEYDWVQLYPDRFEAPRWYYPVTEESRHWPISHHLRLRDFVLDAPWFSLGMPQWVALDPGLLTKLDDLAELMHADGYEFDRFTLIYGYRSPAYNLGRRDRDADESLKSPFSQHMFGRAVDMIIDTDGDQRLDDLNGDGEITVRDAAVIMHYVNILDRRYRSEGDARVGGAGLYDHHDFFERPVQSPYVHVDVRGFLRQNGTLFRWPARWHDTGEPIQWGEL